MADDLKKVKSVDDMSILDKETQRELLAAALLIEQAMNKCKALKDDENRYFSVSASRDDGMITSYTISCISDDCVDTYFVYKIDGEMSESYYTRNRSELED